MLMSSRTMARLGSMMLAMALLAGAGSCKAAAAPSPVLATETFTGTLPVLGMAFHTFTIKYAFATTDLSATVSTLNVTPAVTIGLGFGTVSGTTCAVQVSTTTAAVGQELFAPNGASAGTYCVQIFDAGSLTDTTAYTLTVKHY
jgi:hypothetical protein